MQLNLLIASRKQFHLGSDWWRLFTKTSLETLFELPIRWVLFDLNPDLVINRDKRSWALQQSNSFHQESLSFIDGVILAEPGEWKGRSVEVLYHLIKTFETPLILFFPQLNATSLSSLEKEVLASKNTFVITDESEVFQFFKELGTQVNLQEKPLNPLFHCSVDSRRESGVFFEMSDNFNTRFSGSEIRSFLKQLKETNQLETTKFFPASVSELAYLSQVGIQNIFYNEDVVETLKALSQLKALSTKCPLLQHFAKAHQITKSERSANSVGIEADFVKLFIKQVRNHAPQTT